MSYFVIGGMVTLLSKLIVIFVTVNEIIIVQFSGFFPFSFR